MSFFELAQKRFSVRSYDVRAVEDEKLQYILSCTRMAPSAVNKQPYQFFVVSESALLNQIKQCYHRDWLNDAPVCIVACANHEQAWHRPNDNKDHADIDVAIAVDHLTLAATEVGLGTCWICNFDAVKCAEVLKLDKNVEPVVIVPVGYAKSDVEMPAKKRKADGELFKIVK